MDDSKHSSIQGPPHEPEPTLRPSAINRTMNWREWAMLLALSVLWGGSFFFAGIAVKELPPFTIVVVSVGLASIIFSVLLRLRSVRIPTRSAGVGSLLRDGASQQCSAVLPHRLGPNPYGVRPCLHPQRHDAALHGHRRACPHHGREDDRQSASRRLVDSPGSSNYRPALENRNRHPGADGLSRGGDFLCVRRGLRPAVQADERGAHGNGDRPGDRSTIVMIPMALFVDQPWMSPCRVSRPGEIRGIAVFSTAVAYVLYFRILATAGAKICSSSRS